MAGCIEDCCVAAASMVTRMQLECKVLKHNSYVIAALSEHKAMSKPLGTALASAIW